MFHVILFWNIYPLRRQFFFSLEEKELKHCITVSHYKIHNFIFWLAWLITLNFNIIIICTFFFPIGHILTSPIASSLPTLPFLVLKSLYDSMPLTTDDGVLLRRMSLEIWAIHLILACLSVLSHHLPRVSMPGFQQEVGSTVN